MKWSVCHGDIIIKWSLHRGGLYKKVVFKKWPLNKGFTLGYIYMTV